jgi:hypothetical protein
VYGIAGRLILRPGVRPLWPEFGHWTFVDRRSEAGSPPLATFGMRRAAAGAS